MEAAAEVLSGCHLCLPEKVHVPCSSGVPRNFVWGGIQQIQLRTEDRENGDLGVVAP